MNRPTITQAPSSSTAFSSRGGGLPAGSTTVMMAAGTSQLTSDGMNSTKNSWNATIPFCHTISVVMSPNGLNAPPALAATTMLMHEMAMKR